MVRGREILLYHDIHVVGEPACNPIAWCCLKGTKQHLCLTRGLLESKMFQDKDRQSYYRNLPHWQPQNGMFFVTFRLANSLPKAIVNELLTELEQERTIVRNKLTSVQKEQELYRLDKKLFGKYDDWLHKCVEESPRWLEKDGIAQIVIREIKQLNVEGYAIFAYCLMPNHVHLLVELSGDERGFHTYDTGKNYFPLTDGMRMLKGRTARYCNQELGLRGAFWHHESYDHVVRDEGELGRILNYVVGNPVKAGLVLKWEDWRYTFVNDKYINMVSSTMMS